MRYLSLFSGVGGFDLGLDRAGMTCAGQVEYDAAARSVLERHWPDVPRLNDVREINGDEFGTIDLICGGFPCQDVSVAGRRAGLAGERSGLWYDFRRIVDRVRPGWVTIENVPGLLSSNGGRDFATVVRGLVECGYGVAWRILDAQYFGVPQRRRRVFIVGHLGSGRAAEVLFEREGGAGDIAPSRGPRPEHTRDVAAGLRDGGNTHTLTAEGHDASEDGTGRGVPLVAATLNSGGNNGGFRTEPGEHLVVAFQPRYYTRDNKTGGKPQATADITNAHKVGDSAPHVMALHYSHDYNQDRIYSPDGIAPAHTASDSNTSRNVATRQGVRRLTPRECERLQGFPDDFTAGQADAPRYRQLGNAVAVPVAEWLGRRIMEASME